MFHVQDYQRWRQASARFLERAGRHGAVELEVHRAVDNLNEVMVTIRTRTREDAERLMVREDDLRTALEAAGIDIYPALFVGAREEHISY
jgi:hypothetical protein